MADDLNTLSNHELYPLANAEWKAVKAARAADQPIPASPHLDELNRRNEGGVRVSASKKNGTKREPRAVLHFWHDSKPMPSSQDKLSSVAYFYTKGIDDKKVRLGADEFVALVKTLGVDDPFNSSWDVTLPNGIAISCRVHGDSTPIPDAPEKPKPAAKSTTTKAAAKKAPARTSTAKKPTTRKPATAKKSPAKSTSTATKKAARDKSDVTSRPKTPAATKPKRAASTARKAS